MNIEYMENPPKKMKKTMGKVGYLKKINTKELYGSFIRRIYKGKEGYNNGGKLVCVYVWWSYPIVFMRLRGINREFVEVVVLRSGSGVKPLLVSLWLLLHRYIIMLKKDEK